MWAVKCKLQVNHVVLHGHRLVDVQIVSGFMRIAHGRCWLVLHIVSCDMDVVGWLLEWCRGTWLSLVGSLNGAVGHWRHWLVLWSSAASWNIFGCYVCKQKIIMHLNWINKYFLRSVFLRKRTCWSFKKV